MVQKQVQLRGIPANPNIILIAAARAVFLFSRKKHEKRIWL